MKTIAIIMVSACFTTFIHAQELTTTQPGDEVIYRGEKISEQGAIPVSELAERMNGKEDHRLNAKVEAKIVECCQNKGCWMQVDLGNGDLMRVTFKDYGFFVPLESAGKTVIMEGTAYYKTTSVDLLRHYAEDAGKSKKEINAIKKPEYDLVFEATGLILK